MGAETLTQPPVPRGVGGSWEVERQVSGPQGPSWSPSGETINTPFSPLLGSSEALGAVGTPPCAAGGTTLNTTPTVGKCPAHRENAPVT